MIVLILMQTENGFAKPNKVNIILLITQVNPISNRDLQYYRFTNISKIMDININIKGMVASLSQGKKYGRYYHKDYTLYCRRGEIVYVFKEFIIMVRMTWI